MRVQNGKENQMPHMPTSHARMKANRSAKTYHSRAGKRQLESPSAEFVEVLVDHGEPVELVPLELAQDVLSVRRGRGQIDVLLA